MFHFVKISAHPKFRTSDFASFGMNRLLSAFRGLMQPGFCAGFSTSALSAQASAMSPLRTAVSVVKPPNG
jgi:hypothetical protein